MNEAMRLIEMSKDSLNHTEERTGRLVCIFPLLFPLYSYKLCTYENDNVRFFISLLINNIIITLQGPDCD